MIFQINYIISLPEIFLLLATIFILVGNLFWNKQLPNLTYYISQISLLIIAYFLIKDITFETANQYAWFNSYVKNNSTDFYKSAIVLLSIAVFLFAKQYFKTEKINNEFYILGLFSILGMLVIVSANDFITLYMGLETMSLSIYALIAMKKDSDLAIESAVKYFVIGALSIGITLYGISIVYGVTGSLNFDEIYQNLNNSQLIKENSLFLEFGLVFIVVGMAFKIAAAPFHLWLPDVYQGSTTVMTLFMSSAPKLAVFMFIYKVLTYPLSPLAQYWQDFMIILAVISLTTGAILAIKQTNFRRLLAYSSITHTGFMLLGFTVVNQDGYIASAFYMLVYAFSALIGFTLILLLSYANVGEEIDDLKGLYKKNPWLAFLILFTMFSMAGIPPFIGFHTKFYVIQELIQSNSIFLAIYAVIIAAISVYYYLRIIKQIYFSKTLSDNLLGNKLNFDTLTFDSKATVTILTFLLLILGLYPDLIINLILTGFAR